METYGSSVINLRSRAKPQTSNHILRCQLHWTTWAPPSGHFTVGPDFHKDEEITNPSLKCLFLQLDGSQRLTRQLFPTAPQISASRRNQEKEKVST